MARLGFLLAIILMLTGCETTDVQGLAKSSPPVSSQVQSKEAPKTTYALREGRKDLAPYPKDKLVAKPAPALKEEVKAPEEPVVAAPVLSPPLVKGPVRVAILLPLSGNAAPIGQAMLNAAQMALFEVAGDNFTLLPFDTKGNAEDAAFAAKLALTEGAHLILGPLFKDEVKAVAPLAAAGGVSVISFSSDRTVAGNGVYIMGMLPKEQVDRAMSFAKSKGYSKFALLAPNNDYGRAIYNAVKENISPDTVLVALDYYEPTAQEFSEIVKRMANYEVRRKALLDHKKELEAKALTDEAAKQALQRLHGLETLGDPPFEAIIIPDEGGRMRAIAAMLPYYDIDPARVKLLGTMMWEDSRLYTEPALIGGWFAAPAPKDRLEFEKRYSAYFGAKPARLASLAYDATALAAVLDVSGGDFSARAITSANGFSGVDGIFRFSPDGTSERGLAIMEIAKGSATKIISPAPQVFPKSEDRR